MSTTEVERIIDGVIQREGGFVDHPDDKGGATKYGITWKTYEVWKKGGGHRHAEEDGVVLPEDVIDITPEIARMIYHEKYVTSPRWPEVAEGPLLELLVDSGVHSGPGQAIKWFQRALGLNADGIIGPLTRARAKDCDARLVYVDVLSRRMAFMGYLVKRDASYRPFMEGWMKRMGYFVHRSLDI